MNKQSSAFPRGSEWRQWDLHIHSPASFHWQGQKFSASGDQDSDICLVDQMIAAMNAAKPAVFALMDYWTFDGWFALKRRLGQKGAPKLEKTVFPGIELRLCAPLEGRLNAHAVFSDEIEDQALRDFLSHLRLELTDQPLSPDALRAYARRAGSDKLKIHGFKKAAVDSDDNIAFDAGCKIAELKSDSYKEAIRKAPKGQALGFMPFHTHDGLGSLKWVEHYAYAISLFESSPIFEARDDATWNAFVGRKVDGNAKWIDGFQEALRKLPRLPVSGSDAHRFVGVTGDNNQRGYGDYPSNKATWIKADPTWHGLLQAIKEPRKRCHIGDLPPKLRQIAANKPFYMESISFSKVHFSKLADNWFAGCQIPLNPDLVAIIGNKGGGKSALADALALLGNSQQKSHFSFLRPERFRGRSGEPARQFIGTLKWHAGEPCECNLAEDSSPDRVELVRYIPQGRFEALCNEHVSGKSDAFEQELRSVVFSHIPRELRLGALTFDQLIEEQEKSARARLSEERKKLIGLNRTIAAIEEEMHPDIRKNVEEQLKLKNRELAELTATKPAEVPKPPEELTGPQKEASEAIAVANAAIAETTDTLLSLRDRQAKIATHKRAALSAVARIRLFQSQFAEFQRDLLEELNKIGLKLEDVISLSIDESKLNKTSLDADGEDQSLTQLMSDLNYKIEVHNQNIQTATQALNEPQQVYQAYSIALKDWNHKMVLINGAEDFPDSKIGLEARLKQLDLLPDRLAQKRSERLDLCGRIYEILVEQRKARAELFAPLQKVIADNELIGTEYKLQFQANLSAFSNAISENLFSIVKQNVGDIRGDDESREAIKSRVDAKDLNIKADTLALVEDIHNLLHDSARKLKSFAFDLKPILRKDRNVAEVYDFLYGLEYIQPQYTLLFQDTRIEQLSPGQRGALLLIFYLLVDKGRNPIVLDQPEENLDNQTIVNLLVPVLSLAKEYRQIVMVTHNPNLAVVCDAEQIIMAKFDRSSGANVSYESGSIESPSMNEHVVAVLEGTKPAFDNRGGKYH